MTFLWSHYNPVLGFKGLLSYVSYLPHCQSSSQPCTFLSIFQCSSEEDVMVLNRQAPQWIFNDMKIGKTDPPMRISWMNSLELWFSNLSMHQGYLEDFLKHRLQGSTLRVSDSVGLGWGLRIYISNRLQGQHIKNHCFSLQNGYDNTWLHSFLSLTESSQVLGENGFGDSTSVFSIISNVWKQLPKIMCHYAFSYNSKKFWRKDVI